MSQDAKDAAPSFLSSIGDFDAVIAYIAYDVEAARRAFKQVYEANTAEVPREQFLSDLEKLEQVAESLKSASSLTDKYKVLTESYIPLIAELKRRYSDFISDEISQDLTNRITKPIAIYQLVEAQSVMTYAMEDEREPKDRAGMLYTGIVKTSEVVEKHIKYFSVRIREDIRAIANMFLSDPAFSPDSYASDPTAYNYMIGLKNTARSLLWQLDNYQEETKYTVKGLLDWTEASSGWAGDDFEECLDYVNRARKG